VRIIFAGTPHFAAQALAALLDKYEVIAVLTQPDRPSGRGMQLNASPVKQLAQQRGIPVLQPVTLKSEEAQKEIAALNADVMVVAAYGLILPQAVLQLPKKGCLNIHASLLPRWRGAAPIQRAILAGDKETGITIMQMDVGLDTGDMLLKTACEISESDTAESLHDKLAAMGAEAIVASLRLVEQKQLRPEKQNDQLATYAAKLTKVEAVLDWSLEAVQLDRAVRGYYPFPVAHTTMGDTPIKVIRARVRQQDLGVNAAGTVLAIDKECIWVACGKDALGIEVMQKPGGKALPVAQFIQSFPIKIGDRFGEY
jgi:methionyl-tRNA formyltransferase